MENNFCTEPGVLNVFLIVKTVLNLFKIVVPLVLIIVSMFDIGKAVASNEDELRKVFPSIIRKIIASVLVFLIPSIIGLVLNVIDTNVDYRSSSCWTNADKEIIETLEIAKAAERRAKAEELSMQNYVTIKELYGSETLTEDSSLADRMVAIALDQIGNNGRKYQAEFNAGKNSAWCVMFTWWVTKEAGVDQYMPFKSAGTGEMYRYFRSGQMPNVSWYPSLSRKGASYTPKAGDYIMFRWEPEDPKYTTNHIGIVVETKDGIIKYVHGNTSTNPSTSTVKEGKIKIDSSEVVGYGSWY